MPGWPPERERNARAERPNFNFAPAPRQKPRATTSVTAAHRRASIAVMPFVDRSQHTGTRGGAADALAHDVITRLAKLRSLFVIAQGTVFALHERRIGARRGGPHAERRLSSSAEASGAAAPTLPSRSNSPRREPPASSGPRSFDHKLDEDVLRSRRDRQPDRCVHRQRDRDRGAQPRHPEAAEFARRLGGPSSRALAHVPVQPARQRAGQAVLPEGRASSIRPSHAPMRVCPSRIFKMPSRVGPTAAPRSIAPSRPPAKA